MWKSSTRRRNLIAAAGAAALAGLGGSPADAGLMMDLRVLPGQPNYFHDKAFFIATPGDTVTLGLFAVVTGTNGVNDETFQLVYGLINSVGTVKGNLSGGYLPAFFSAGASQNGSVLDWDSDGDLDIGLSPTSSGAMGKFLGRSSSPVAMPSLNGEVQVGEFVFTATDTSAGAVDINFTFRNNNGNNVGAAALWFEDGSVTAKNPTTGFTTVGLPVGIAPEPSSIALMGLGGIGLLKRRRR